MAEATPFTTPVGRLVQGSLYTPQTEDFEGRPLVVKTGANAGQPRVDFFFALAIAKGAEQHWNQTSWGRLIWDVGQKAWPSGQANSPQFSWKITDGDSNVPNKKGRKPCDREGYPRHWVVNFSSSYAPRIYNANGTQPITDVDAVKLGYYVQVAGSAAGNESAGNPGVYLNHSMVALSGYGPEIVLGPDPASVGFGQSPLPAGASAVPLASTLPPVATPSAPTPPYVPPPAPVAPPLAVTPNPAFLNPPVAAPPPPAPPAAPVHAMLPAANGASYEQLRAAGWTDAQLVQHGMMAA